MVRGGAQRFVGGRGVRAACGLLAEWPLRCRDLTSAPQLANLPALATLTLNLFESGLEGAERGSGREGRGAGRSGGRAACARGM